MVKTTTMYLYGDGEQKWEIGKKLRLSKKVMDNFYPCYEVEVGIEVETKTGDSRIVSIDGRKVDDGNLS